MKKDESKNETLEQYDFPLDVGEYIFTKEEKYSKAIGEFLIYFSNLESSLNLFISEIINQRSHDLGYKIIKSLTYNNKVKLAKDLCFPLIDLISDKTLKKRLKSEFDEIVFKMIELGQFRNKVAHANWVTLDKENYVRTKITQSESGPVEFVKIKITPTILGKLTIQCSSLAGRIGYFSNRFFEVLE